VIGIIEQLVAMLAGERARRENLEELRRHELAAIEADMGREDLRAPWRDALALVRAWLDSDEQRRTETLRAVLEPYPHGSHDLAIVMAALVRLASESDEPLEALVEFWARRVADENE
jgi:hypothetical protein